MSGYISDYNAQRRHLSRLTRELSLPVSRSNGKRKVPLSNAELRVQIHDACLGPDWGDLTQGTDAGRFDQELARMVRTLEMGHGFELAAAQACIRAGKHEMRMGRSDMEILRGANGRVRMRPMTHEHRMARFKAAEEFYALAREYQSAHAAKGAFAECNRLKACGTLQQLHEEQHGT